MKSTRTAIVTLGLALLGLSACGAPQESTTEEPAPTTGTPGTTPGGEPTKEPPTGNPPTFVPPAATPTACTDDLSAILFPAYPELTHPELLGQLESQDFLAMLETTLNSSGDSLKLKFGGQVDIPIVAPVGVAGDASLQLSVTVADDGKLVLEGGADATRAANVSVNVASISGGKASGVGVRWRFDTHADVAQAIRHLVLLKAIGPGLEGAATVLHSRVADVNGLLADVQSQLDGLVDWVAEKLGLEGKLIARLRELRDEHDALTTGLERLDDLTGRVTAARAFLNGHFAGVRLELGAQTSVKIGASLLEVGGGDADDGSSGGGTALAKLEASLNVERTVTVDIPTQDIRAGVEADITLGFRSKENANLGIVVAGIAVDAAQKLEIKAHGALSTDGVSIDKTLPTAVIELDRAFQGSIGLVLSGNYGLGRKSQVKIGLAALGELATESIENLIAGDPEKTGEALSRLPITFSGQARIDRGLALGIGLTQGQDFFTAKVGVNALWTDAGDTASIHGFPCREALIGLVSSSMEKIVSDETFELLDQLGMQVQELRTSF